MTATDSQLVRLAADWATTAKESVSVEQVGDTLYGFCSELGALRIGNSYRLNDAVRVDYSENLGKWFVSLDLPA